MPAEKYIWNWNEAIFLKAVVDRCNNNINREEMFKYLSTAMNKTMTEANGLHPNAVASGLGMALLARITDEDVYKQKASDIYTQLLKIPKASNGGISHRDNVIELWDDTVYMIDIFLLEMYKLTGEQKYLDDAIFQILAHAQKLEDKNTGLWYHGWDNDSISTIDPCCQLGWADNENRRNNEFWGRGNGWIAMILADVLEVMPPNMPERIELQTKFVKMMETLQHLQDPDNGHWYQLPIYPREEGNFIESSCTAMFAYAITMGIKNGILSPDTYLPIIDNAYKGIYKYSIKPFGKYLTMDNICAGTCIGDKAYYYEREIVSERPFAFGSAIMFFDQYNMLNH